MLKQSAKPNQEEFHNAMKKIGLDVAKGGL